MAQGVPRITAMDTAAQRERLWEQRNRAGLKWARAVAERDWDAARKWAAQAHDTGLAIMALDASEKQRRAG